MDFLHYSYVYYLDSLLTCEGLSHSQTATIQIHDRSVVSSDTTDDGLVSAVLNVPPIDHLHLNPSSRQREREMLSAPADAAQETTAPAGTRDKMKRKSGSVTEGRM